MNTGQSRFFSDTGAGWSSESIRPRGLFQWSIILLILIHGLLYWLVLHGKYPDIPLSVLLMFRPGGDIGYFPLITALAQEHLGETALWETQGQGWQSFPFPPLLVHSLLFRLLGPPGYVVADLIVLYLFYFAALALFRVVRIPSPLRELAALLILFHETLEKGLASITSGQFNLPLALWGIRLPRPFVTGLFFMWALSALLVLISGDAARNRARTWILIGLTVSLLIQSEIYFAFTTLFWLGACLAGQWLADPSGRRILNRGFLILAVTGLLSSLPFLLQRVAEHPDVTIRLGVFQVSRMAPLFLPIGDHMKVLGMDLLVSLLVLVILLGNKKDLLTPVRLRIWMALIGLCVSSYVALPLSCVVLGKTVQVYHFSTCFEVISSYLALIGFLWLLLRGLLLVANASPRNSLLAGLIRPGNPAGPFLLLAMLGVAWGWSCGAFINKEVENWRSLAGDRVEFANLCRELSRRPVEDYLVLGTFDSRLYSWWNSFQAGFTFLPDPFITPSSDREIESRLAAFSKTVGMNSGDFVSFLTQIYHNAQLLGANKYQASRAHSLAPLADYEPRDQERIKKTTFTRWTDCWNLAVPLSERKRLADVFSSTPAAAGGASADRRLDWVVLNKYPDQIRLSPPAELFELVYQSRDYRVWHRKQNMDSVP